MVMLRGARILIRRIGALVFLIAVACHHSTNAITTPPDARSRTIRAVVGQELRIRVGVDMGPAQYEEPPQVSSSAVTYLGQDALPPITPAGPNRQFRFKAVTAGTAIVRFRRLLGDSVVSVIEDIIRVR